MRQGDVSRSTTYVFPSPSLKKNSTPLLLLLLVVVVVAVAVEVKTLIPHPTLNLFLLTRYMFINNKYQAKY
jgi:hypothetical protein